jgi:peptide deformylase
MVRNILVYPDPFLARKAAPVARVDDGVRELVRDMFDTMYESEGIGLAAWWASETGEVVSAAAASPIALINPEIVGREGEMTTCMEGCLSVPGVQGEVTRPEGVVVSGLNENGEPVTLRAGGILARCLQHEIDHLDGVLFIDRISAPIPAPPASGK